MNGLAMSVGVNFSRGVVIKDDPRLNNGSILLVEPARDGTGGLPSTWINYAADQFRDRTGIYAPSVEVVNTLSGHAKCLVERTARGAVHGVMTPDPIGMHATRWAYGVVPASTVFEYLFANRNHAFYFGMIGRVTRNATVADITNLALGGLSPTESDVVDGATVNRGFGIYQAQSGNVAGAPLPTQEHYLNRRVDSNQPYFADIAVTGHSMSSLTPLTQARREIFTAGERAMSPTRVGWPSHMLYTLWIEDLTASGRTYAECSAEGVALMGRRFSEGGEYFGDTFTSPGSVP